MRQQTLLIVTLFLGCLPLAAETPVQAALARTLAGTPAASVVAEVATGREVARIGLVNRRTTPGSVLKPLFLAAALEQHYTSPRTTVFCRRDLLVQTGHRHWNLACTHPQTNVAFSAEEALAYSCNQYFAALADRMPPGEIAATLRHYGLTPTADVPSAAQKVLEVLGLNGISVSPEELAQAWRRLANEIATDAQVQPVSDGLKDSVTFGMAHNAAVPGMVILGKTGTASQTENGTSHGWFAGITQLNRRTVVIVIYLPQGNGADAAHLAQRFFLAASKP